MIDRSHYRLALMPAKHNDCDRDIAWAGNDSDPVLIQHTKPKREGEIDRINPEGESQLAARIGGQFRQDHK